MRAFVVTRRFAGALGILALVAVLLPGTAALALLVVGDLVLLALAVADFMRAAGAGVVTAERVCSGKLSLDASNDVTIRVSNVSSRPARVIVRDLPPVEFDLVAPRVTLALPARGEAEHHYRVRPPNRGLYRFGDLWLRSIGPLGLAGRQFRVSASAEVKVLPNIKAIGEYELLARRGALYEIGIRAAHLRGGGTEFESLREYGADDDYRRIDWKATARHRRPITQVLSPERSQTMVLAIDAGRLMAPRIDGVSKLDYAINAALMMAYVGSATDDLIGLVVFGREVQTYLPPRKGRAQFLAILDALYRVEGETSAEPDYARALRYAAAKTSKRSLFVVFSDLAGVEPSRRLLTVLSSLLPRHLPLLVTMRDQVVEDVLRRVPDRAEEAYEQAVAQRVLADRAEARRALTERGALVLDALPKQLSVATVNAYLDVKARGRL